MFSEKELFFRLVGLFGLTALIAGLASGSASLKMIGIALIFSVEVAGYGTISIIFNEMYK